MAKRNKLSERFQLIPPDFTWEELVAILSCYGYEEISTGKTSGSRRRFADKDKNVISVHKLHPQNAVKKYALREVFQTLKDKGVIKDE